ncbi:MAG: radical SAM protein [Thermaerobacter sp.]|nr:radical SAM protein [Thermaerobacter sp.]
MDLNRQPRVVTWEITRACQLHCQHCRAEAIVTRNPQELSYDQMMPVLDDMMEAFDVPPILVYTGGDPLERQDLDDLIRAAVVRGFPTAVAPSVTDRLTEEVIWRWQDLGVRAVSLSLDGPTAQVHDQFRGVPGTYDRTLEMADAIVRSGMMLQINTSVAQSTRSHLVMTGDLVRFLGANAWELFFVIPTGRAMVADAPTADDIEQVLSWLAHWAEGSRMRITTVGAPQWVRVRQELGAGRAPRVVVREARGFAFIDHLGQVFPSGYLPVAAGSVASEPFSRIYRDSPLFQQLRNPACFEGRCGTCDFAALCGGSRARAYAVTGNVLAEDPGCRGIAREVTA